MSVMHTKTLLQRHCQHCRVSDTMLVIDCRLGKHAGQEEVKVHVTSIQVTFRNEKVDWRKTENPSFESRVNLL